MPIVVITEAGAGVVGCVAVPHRVAKQLEI